MWAAIGVPRRSAAPHTRRCKRIIEAHEAGQRPGRQGRGRNFDQVRDLVAERVEETAGRISAKRLLPAARAAGYAGSARNFRRLVAQVKRRGGGSPPGPPAGGVGPG